MKMKLLLILFLLTLFLSASPVLAHPTNTFPPGYYPGWTVCVTRAPVPVYRQPVLLSSLRNERTRNYQNQFIFTTAVYLDREGTWWRQIVYPDVAVTTYLETGWVASNASSPCAWTYTAR